MSLETVSKRERTNKLKEKYGDEMVFVVPAEETKNFGEGFTGRAYSTPKTLENNGFFVERYLAEYNPLLRQPLPYVVVKCGNKYFRTRRLSGSGEARLVGKMSVGMGGHVNPCDKYLGVLPQTKTLWHRCIERELKEELYISLDNILSTEYIGFINDNSNEVSRDHLALVFIVEVREEDVSVKEIDKHDGAFATLEEIKKESSDGFNNENIESWSQIVLKVLEELEEVKND